jgi:hypothetical protein
MDERPRSLILRHEIRRRNDACHRSAVESAIGFVRHGAVVEASSMRQPERLLPVDEVLAAS